MYIIYVHYYILFKKTKKPLIKSKKKKQHVELFILDVKNDFHNMF